MELLFLVELFFFRRYYYIKKIKNTENPSDKVLKKLAWLKGFKKDPHLKEGNKVYLLIKNLKSRRLLLKLDHVKVGPFLVDKLKKVPEGQPQDNY